MLGVGTQDAKYVYVGNVAAQEVYLGGVKVWPTAVPPQLFTFTAYTTWAIPAGATKVDLVMCGAGGGAGNGTLVGGPGYGGYAGKWFGKTLVVGTDIAAGASITFTPGKGGAGGGALNTPAKGEASTADYVPSGGVMATLTGAGGDPGDFLNPTAQGLSPGNYTFDGYTYTGGVGGNTSANNGPGTDGTAPGGGGGGGGKQTLTQLGGAGGAGVCYARVYF